MKFYKLIASGLGTGYAPIAPGTVGSMLGILIFYSFNLALKSLNIDQSTIPVLNLVVIIFFLLIGIYSIKKVHQKWSHDAPKIVIDEIVGVWIAAFLIPFQWQYYLLALILFRFFDIVKPLYIRKLDKLKSNWSVMFDDVLAGFYANIVIQIVIHFNII